MGAGFATIVPTFGTWALLVIAATSRWEIAAGIGIAFGIGRGALLLTNRSVRSPSSLAMAMRRFAARETAGRAIAVGGFLGVLLLGLIDVN